MSSENGHCPRCGRVHSGVCGIPPTTTLRGRTSIRTASDSTDFTIPVWSKHETRLTNGKLNDLLVWGREHEQQIVQMIRMMPADLPEYGQLMERLDKVELANRQLRLQIALRRLGDNGYR